MDRGRGRSFWGAGLLLALLGGCVANRAQIEQAVLSNHPQPAHFRDVAAAYQARCPDVLRVEVAGLSHYSGVQRIGPDGRIELGEGHRLTVDGETTPEITRTVAETIHVPEEQVHVEIAEYNSQFLYLFGEVAGLQRAVPYHGPETVLDLLRRVGGLTAGAAMSDIKVIRPHVAEGKTPEVFHIDLAAIVLKNDADTNITLQPYDQVHIGQSRRSSFSTCLPPWLRPVYDRLCGMKRSG
jgi:protein involved in polysaccharide export with SLBB domain